MKTAWIDVETTGVDHERCGILQVAIIIEGKGTPIREVFKSKPFDGAEVSKEALEVTGVTEEELQSGDRLTDKGLYTQLVALLDKCVYKYDKKDKLVFCGYNARFDMDMLRELFKRNGNSYFGSYFWFPPCDIMQLAFAALIKQRCNMPNFKLTTAAKALGISVDETAAHDALYDITITKEVAGKSIRLIAEVWGVLNPSTSDQQ